MSSHRALDPTRHEDLGRALGLIYIVGLEQATDGGHLDAVLMGGVRCIWLRAPEASGRALYRAARTLVTRCHPRGVAVLVGDRGDVALAAGADGVHLGFRSPPPSKVRAWFPGWMGVSCHNLRELEAAEAAGADYVTLSPVFGVPDKGAPLGTALLERWARETRLPVVALGGIDADNVPRVRALPVAGVAVIRALREAREPTRVARQLAQGVA